MLVLLCFLVPVSLDRAPCTTTKCPEYTLMEEHESFQKRSYNQTRWLTTNITSKSIPALMDANNRLGHFCSDNGIDLKKSWPAVITVNSNVSYSLSWFVPKGVNVQTPANISLVELQNKDSFEVYVSSFDGIPSMQNGQSNAELLWDDLKSHLDKSCSTPAFSGVTYNPFVSLVHNNEIWISVNDICETSI